MTRSVAGSLLVIAALAAIASPANADVTHPFKGTFAVGGGNPQPADVDANGDLLIWRDNTRDIVKLDKTTKAAVPFADLGTNVLNGSGGFDCPNTPADCDRVPSNEFHSNTNTNGPMVAVDHSTGPNSGYIYVNNPDSENEPGAVEVFSPGGKFLGRVPIATAGPQPVAGRPFCDIDVDSNGHLYVLMGGGSCGQGLGFGIRFAPTDGTPGNMLFVGQLASPRDNNIYPRTIWPQRLSSSTDYSYMRGGQGFKDEPFFSPLWTKYPQAQWFTGGATAVPLGPPPIFADGGNSPCNGFCAYRFLTVDDSNQDVVIVDSAGDLIEKWSTDDEQIGPIMSGTIGTVQDVVIDPTNTASKGTIYIRGNAQNLSYWGPPVVIPDINDVEASAGHTDVTVKASIDTAGAGEVTECKVELGTNPVIFSQSTPCSPATPFSEETAIEGTIGGLAVEQDYYYRVSAKNANGENRTPPEIVHTNAVLDVETGPATEIDLSSAVLNGSLDTDGMATDARFEYGINSEYGQTTPVEAIPGVAGATQVTPAQITNLQVGRRYHYRLVASNELGTSFGPDRTFVVAHPPTISSAVASNVTATEADVTANVNPGGTEATYYFEYGPTTDYGIATEVKDLAASDSAQEVSEHLSGLQSGVTYHFRLVAENKWGTTFGDDTTFDYLPPACPNAHVRQQTLANYLPDCRAYELVSPPAAGGIQLFASDSLPDLGSISPGIDSELLGLNSDVDSTQARFLFYGAIGNLPGTNPPNSYVDWYVASRTSSGWESHHPGLSGDESLLAGGLRCSATLHRCFDFNLFTQGGLNEGGNQSDPRPYLWEADGSFVGRLPTNSLVVPNAGKLIGASQMTPDFRHYVFSSRDVPFTPQGLGQAPGSVYDNDVLDTTLETVSYLPNGQPIPLDPQSELGEAEYVRIPAVSDDGSHILMSTNAGPGRVNLYLRIDNAYTIDLAQGAEAQFVDMTSDGHEVTIASEAQLTADDHDTSKDLFVWSLDTEELTRVSQGFGNGDSDACNTSWTDGCGAELLTLERNTDNSVAADSGDVYFYSPEQLDASNPGVFNQRNLYVYRNGAVQYVTTLDPNSQVSRMQVSPNGLFAALVTNSQLTSYDNAGFKQMYSYDVAANHLKCVSCKPDGSPPSHDVRASASGLFMSDDGRTFFATRDALVAADSNSEITDVYEFVNGRPQLLTSGIANADTWGGSLLIFPPQQVGLEAVSHDGVDVFFSTFETLVPQDENGEFFKFYNARTNGGFAVQPPPLPCAAADECHGETSSSGDRAQIVTGVNLGEGGNVIRTAKAKSKARRKARRARAAKRRRARAKRQRRAARERRAQRRAQGAGR